MKVRMINNKIRYRLRKSDFRILDETKEAEVVLKFPNNIDFIYKIEISDTENIVAQFVNNTILLELPQIIFQQWKESVDVGIETYLPLFNEDNLCILLEKDFPCKHTHDMEDTFFELVPIEENC